MSAIKDEAVRLKRREDCYYYFSWQFELKHLNATYDFPPDIGTRREAVKTTASDVISHFDKRSREETKLDKASHMRAGRRGVGWRGSGWGGRGGGGGGGLPWL